MAAPDFTTSEHLLPHLSRTFTPLQTLTPISGGYANFTFRAALPPSSPLAPTASVVIKHAAIFAAFDPTILLDPIRCFFEHSALATPPPSITTPAGITVSTPAVHYYDPINQILALTDAGPTSKDLKTHLLSGAPLSSAPLGLALGLFLHTLHTWGRTSPLRRSLEAHTQAPTLWKWCTYGRLLATVEQYPLLLGPKTQLLQAVAAAPDLDAAEKTVIHGDFWCGNILLREDGDVFVVDWEMARVGYVWEDLGQMCAELYLPVHFRGREEGAEMLAAFLKGYGGMGEEVARRAVVHFGVHLVVWPCRISGWGEEREVEECVRVGMEFIEKGWERDWAWVAKSVLKAIVDDEWIKRD